MKSILSRSKILHRHIGLALVTFAAACAVMGASEPPGQQLFNAQCIACHGVDAGGIDSLGVGLIDSEFVTASSQEELIEFLKVGRMPTDPESVTGLVMPGFPWMAETELAALAKYLQGISE